MLSTQQYPHMEAADLRVAEPEPSFCLNDATNRRAQLPALAVLGKDLL
jgi:hypothetical protein